MMWLILSSIISSHPATGTTEFLGVGQRRRRRGRDSSAFDVAQRHFTPAQAPLSLLVFWLRLMNDRGLGQEVIGNRFEVAVAQIFEAILDRLPHRTLYLALLRGSAGPQELDDVLLYPLADAGARVRCDIGDELAVRSIRSSGEPLAGSQRAEEIARGMTLATMGERGDEINAVVLGGTPLGLRMERLRGKEQDAPAGLQEAPGEWERHVVRPVLTAHRRERKQIRLDRQCVAVGNAGKARIGKYREVVCPVGPHALAQCAQKLRVGPVANAGFRIGRDIRGVKGAERRGQGPAAG